MEIGKRVRVLKTIDLGQYGKVEKGTIGVLESMNNGPYTPFLVKFPQGSFAFEDGELEDVESPDAHGDPR
ncbi:MAG: hypothetical protein JO219_01090 [Candidatus Eremiobacteraeota bacterium]|nr:hypothetical protein [Candidatus Eremiobacteraeota bacterium]MBV8365683.1 hypothetical protein [Candidatus Eremiobacteraeota bacterium]